MTISRILNNVLLLVKDRVTCPVALDTQELMVKHYPLLLYTTQLNEPIRMLLSSLNHIHFIFTFTIHNHWH